MGRKGNVLIEILFSFFIIGILVHGLSLMFNKLINVELDSNNDISYCLYALSKEISLANSVDVVEHELYLYNENEVETIYLHNHRIVKSPGFNIYLNNVDELTFDFDDYYVYMTIKRGEIIGTFKVGVYYRPSFRVCESNGDPNCSDAFNSEFNDDSSD